MSAALETPSAELIFCQPGRRTSEQVKSDTAVHLFTIFGTKKTITRRDLGVFPHYGDMAALKIASRDTIEILVREPSTWFLYAPFTTFHVTRRPVECEFRRFEGSGILAIHG